MIPDTEAAYYAEAFARNIGILNKEEQEILQKSTVGIAGMGGVGGIFTLGFARLGLGGFHLADPDAFAIVNMNRQAGAMVSTEGKSKTGVMQGMVLDINPYARVKTFTGEEESLDAFLDGVDIVVDAIDFFTIQPRRQLNQAARKKGKIVLCAGPVGFGSAMQVFDPQGMSFDEYYDIHDGMSEEDMVLHFGLGLAPALLQRSYFQPAKVSFKEHAAPSLVSGTLLAANLVTTEATKILLKRGKVDYIPHTSHFDPYVKKYRQVYLPWGNRTLSQWLKIRYVRRMLKKSGSI